MTYAQLLQQLQNATPEQLNQTVTVYVSGEDEYYSLVDDFPVCTATESDCDQLDEGHLYLVV